MMNCIAIAAMKTAITCATTEDPVFPSNEWILGVSLMTNQLNSITITTEPNVTKIP